MSADTRKKIYDILKNKTGFMDSYEDFDNDITTSEDARKKVYEVLRDKTGFNDTYENFVSGISGEVQRESAIPPAKEESGNVVTTVQSPSYPQRAETKERILNNIPDYFRSRGNDLSTLPLPRNTMSEEKPADIPGRIVQDEQQRIQLAERAANDPYMRQQELEHVFKPKNQEQINTVRNLIEEQNKRLDKRLSIHSGSGNNAFNALANSTRYNMETSDDRNQKAVLGYAEKLIEQAQNFTDQAKRKGNTNFVSNLARGIRDTPLDVWAMGLADLRDYAVAKKVMDKVDKGEELNPAEDALMQALVTNAATQMYYTGDLGRGYKAGSMIGESLPFIADMLLGMGTIQAVTKPAAKSLLKYATEKAVKYGLGKATTGLAKGAARTISGLRDVAAHTATFGSQRVAADYLRRGLGDIQVKPNEDGTVSYDGRENIQTGGEALGKSIVSTAAEAGSELLGEYFAPMLGWIGRATGANRIGKIIPASVGKAYSNLVNSQGFKQVQEIARRAKIADPIGEYGEEVVNNLVSTAIGDMTPEQLVDLDNNIDTFLGVAPMSALFGAAGTGGYLREKYRNYRNMREFENQMRDTMGEDWSGVREALQDADIETARGMVKDVLSSDMQPEMKRRAIMYISSSLREQTLQEIDKQQTPERIASEKKDIISNMNNAERVLSSKYGMSKDDISEALDISLTYPDEEVVEKYGDAAEDLFKYMETYRNYINYISWVEGMAYDARKEAESQVERMTNATTGTVMRVNSGLSRNPVNIMRGNIVFDSNGKVDKDKSDNTIYYLSEDGKVKMAPISMFESLVDDTPAEELAYQAGEDAEQEFIQAEEAQLMQPEQSVQPIELETTFQKDGVTYVVSQKSPDGYVVDALDEEGNPVQSNLLTEEQIRTAMTPAIQEEQTSQEQFVQSEDVTQPEPQQVQNEPQTAISRIPVNENGEHDFESAPYQDTSSALIEISENVDDAKDTAAQMINHYQEELKKADKAKTTGNTIQEIVRLKQQKKANIQSINDKIAYWNSVANDIESKRPGGIIEQAKEESDANQQRLSEMTAEQQKAAQEEVQKKIDSGAYERKEPRKRARYVNEDNEMGTANTPMEHVLREIATGRVTFKWNDSGETQGLGSHLGLASSPEERRRMIWALSSDGMTPEAAAEQIHADMPETLQGMVTDQDVFNMILESFQQYGTPSKMWEAAKSMHGTDIEESAPGYEDYMEQQALELEASQNNMTVEEWISYCDYIEEELDNMYSSVSDEDLNAIFERFNEQIISENESRGNETESAGSTEGQTDGEQGDELLPEGRGNNEGADTTVNEQPEPANQADGESGGVVPEPGSEVTREKETYDGALNNGNDSVSSQNNLNGREHEQGEVAGVSGESGSLDGKNEAEAYLRRAGDRTTAEDGQSRWTRNTLLRDVVQRNKGHQTWIDDIQSIINGERIGLGGENDVYLSRDGKSVVKINDFSYLPENSTNFDSFMNRVDAHNELFPHDAITILGFTLNSDGKVSVVLSQPYISNAREATQEEIDNFLEEMGFYTDMSGNWTDGTYEIADTKPNNVLVDEDGNLHFIDVIPYDSRKPGKMLEIPAKRNAFVAPDIKKGEDVLDYIHRVAKAKEIHDAERETDTNPTEAQKEAGNYKKGHVKVDGFDITIENPKGSVRSGKDADGKEWSVTMKNDYGYIRGTEGVDGDHIDVFLSDNPEQGNVYVIDQVNQKTGEYDESKVMYGFNSLEEAKDAYLANFEEGWKVGVVSGVSKEEFRKWIESSARKTKPFSEYKNVDVISTENDGSENNILNEENVVVVSKMETTTNEEKLINQNKENKKTTESKFLSESEYIKQKVDEDFKNSGIEDRQEWDESDESIDSFNKASDEYPDYISNLSDSGELQRIYDQSNIGEKIKIRESVEAAGYEINELIDTSKEKSAAKEKRNRKREARSKELMEKIGIKSDDVRFRETDVNFSDFAAKHKLNEADVKKYAQSMRNGNLGGASYAFKSIHRSVRLQNDNLSLGQFVKVFSPIKKELYDTFGNLDSLREEYVQREIEERNMMEAAKKRIEEEDKAESQRLLEFENMSDQEMDKAYFKALEDKNESRMRDIVNESARRKGYMSIDEFRMSHRAPSYDKEGIDKSMIDVANNKDNIRDSLNEQMRMNQDKNRKESVNAINNALSSIEKDGKAMVTIYRAVPKSIKESNVRNGDWVTLSESYAKQHGNHALEGNYRIIKEEVPAENLYWDGNDINEWGYDDRNDYRYKDTKNNRKLNDLVVRDDNGNIIPPSKRFNSRKKDTRFRFIGEQGAANLDAAEEANTRLDNLAVAREMEKSGKDAKSIKIATGWERGSDGKWRYEEEDFEYIPKGNAREKSLLEREPWHKELMSLSDKVYNGEKLSNEEEVRFDELSKKETELKDSLKKSDIKFLDDYVSDNTLFKEYPELKQVKVEFYDGSFFDGGSYSHHDMTIRINNNSPLDAKSILVHEVQHAIQHIEGFSRGGNSRTYRNYLNSLKEKRDAWSMIDEFEEKSKELGSDASKMDVYKAVRDEYTSLGMSFGDGIMPSRDAFDEGFNLWVRGYDKEGYEDAYKEYQNLIEKFGLGESKDRYHELSGEVEARNVQSRLNMTPEERRSTLASETEDVAREDQIFLYDSMGTNSMVIDANQISESLNVPVQVINSIDEVPEGAAKEAIQKGRKVKGWYDVNTRKVYVYLPNATSADDVRQTILHEGVAHYGLRKLVGDERMDDFLDEVFRNVSKEIRNKIVGTLPKYGYDSRVATEEYLARMAESGVDVSTWERIKQAFKNLLRRIGINIQINDNELKYILWRSAQNLDKNRPIDLAIDVAMQYNMGVGNYFREGESDGSREEYENSLKGWKYKAREAYQDSMLALKNLQEVIANVSGKPIKSFEDAYKAENQLSSKNTAEAEEYYEKFFKPMLEAEGKMMKNYGLSHKEIERYMMLAHGIERNVEMTFREKLNEIINTNPNDAQQFADDFIMERERLRNVYSGYEYLKALSDYIGEVGDFSATEAILTSIDNEEHTDFQNEALEYVKDFESKYDTSALWDKTNRATKETLKKTYESGMMDKDHFAKVSKMFMYYVPLRGWNEKTAEDVYEYINSERSPLNSVLKSMKGRKSVPDEVMATIGNMAESAILQGNKNLMKQSFMNMVMNHPTDVATMRKAWYVYDQAKDEWTISMPEIQDNDTPEIISQKISDHEEKMKNLKEKGLATQKSSGLNIDYRILKNNISQHAVVVKNVGKDYIIYVNGNPRAAQAVNGLTNPDAEKNPIFNSISRANRWLAANFTTRNPAFVIINLVRDMIFSMSAIGIKEDAKYSAKFRKNLFVAIPTVFDCIRGKCKNSQSDMYFKEFVKNGGETGYMHLNDVDKYKKKVKKELSKITGERGSAKAALDYTLERLEDFNRWAEDVSRFAVYMTSRQMGRSIVDSVNDAKEVTVNFNKKGAGYKTGGFFGITAGIMRNLYLFFNASAQSLSNFNRLRVKNPVRFYSTLGGFIAAGVIMPVINDFLYNVLGGGDDNPYNDLPEWVRRNNLCIYAGNGQFVTIPLPIELRAFYGLGDYAYQLSTGREKPTPTGIAKGTVSQLADLLPLNPTGNEGLKTFMPDALSPIFETYVWNEDFTGKPIAKLTPFNERDPEWKRVYKGTSGWLVDASKFFNDLTNGGGPGSDFRKGFIDFNPAKVENLLESYFGGMAKFLNQSGKTIYYGAKSMAEGEMDENLVARNVPIVNRFYNKVDDRNAFSGINTEYFNLRDEMEQFKYELNGVKKNYRNNPEEYRQIVNSDMFRKYMRYKPYQDRLDRLYKMEKELEGQERKQVEDMIIEIRRELVNSLK